MKRNFILPLLIPLAMICSCEKQDAPAEEQLAQRKAELDAREKAVDERMDSLDERVNSLDKKVKELAEIERAMASSRLIRSPGQASDAEQVNTEKERVIRQFPAEIRALMSNSTEINAAKAEKDRQTQAQRSQKQPGQKFQKQMQSETETSGGAVFAAPDTSSPTPSETPQ